MRCCGIMLALACVAFTPAHAEPSPLAEGLQGKLQCYTPDPARKTCQSMASYRARADGGYDNTAFVLVSPSPQVVMIAVSPVEVRGEQECGVMRPADIDTANFTVQGRAADPRLTGLLREKVKAALQDRFNHEICTTYVPDGEALTAQASLDGVRQPSLDQAVIWVAPTDGYRVAP